jgi:hypothetical protein
MFPFSSVQNELEADKGQAFIVDVALRNFTPSMNLQLLYLPTSFRCKQHNMPMFSPNQITPTNQPRLPLRHHLIAFSSRSLTPNPGNIEI